MKRWPLLFLFGIVLSALGKSDESGTLAQSEKTPPAPTATGPQVAELPDDLRQELDIDVAALSQIPSDPLIRPDPLAWLLHPIDRLAARSVPEVGVKFGATYTFLNQYATITPEEVRHDQLSGRLDFTGAWSVYRHGSTAGSLSLLVRSGTNIGRSQQFNLSDGLGSGLYLDCLQGGGEQRPIMLNVLYWRQDLFYKRLSFYVGKIHPNEFVSLSMFNNDERTQFLNGQNDGDLVFASDGTYAGGGAVEFAATRHVYVHAIAVDTKGSAQSGLQTLADRKYMEAIQFGWFTGSLGREYRDYRVGFWRDDTRNQGSGYGGGFAFDHELSSGWSPFGRFGFATNRGTSIKDAYTLGVAHVHPFHRSGDMFGTSVSYTQPTRAGLHHESIWESFYRLRLTQSAEIGPDVEVSIHPTYATRKYSTTLLGMRMRITF